MRSVTPLSERFWRHVDQSGDCWVWTGSLTNGGYGHLGLGGRDGGTDRAHRVSWRLHFGEIPSGLWVLHKCDNPPCVRPEHLFLGTHDDNMRDCVSKSRHRAATRRDTYYTSRMGRPVGITKFSPGTLDHVRALGQHGFSHRAIAASTGVSKSMVGQILKGAK